MTTQSSKDSVVLRRKSSVGSTGGGGGGGTKTTTTTNNNNKRNVTRASIGSQLFARCLRSSSLPLASFRSSYRVLVSFDDGDEFDLIRKHFMASIGKLATFAPPNISSTSTTTRLEKQWNETVPAEFFGQFRAQNKPEAIRLQCSIHELFICEYNLCHNLRVLTHLYRPLLLEAGLLTLAEANQVFGQLERLYSVHEMFVERLAALRTAAGVYRAPGAVMATAVGGLAVYSAYCANLAKAKALVRAKSKVSRFANLLATNPLVREFGQKLDLCSHLDQPRRHLMKYSLLLGRIAKLLDDDENASEVVLLQQAIDGVHSVLVDIERQIAEHTYRQTVAKLVFEGDQGVADEADEANRRRVAESNTFVHRCAIAGRGARRGKHRKASLHLFLFNQCLVIAQKMAANNTAAIGSRYQVLETISPTGRLWYEMVGNAKKGRAKGRSKLLWQLQRKTFYKLRSGNTRHHVRLYTEATAAGQSLDVCLKLQTAEEVSLWLKRLKTYYALASNEANATGGHSRTATTLSCSYVLE